MESEKSKPASASDADKIKQLFWVFIKPTVIVAIVAISMIVTQYYLMPTR